MVSCVTEIYIYIHWYINFFCGIFFEASRRWVCYQWGLLSLVYITFCRQDQDTIFPSLWTLLEAKLDFLIQPNWKAPRGNSPSISVCTPFISRRMTNTKQYSNNAAIWPNHTLNQLPIANFKTHFLPSSKRKKTQWLAWPCALLHYGALTLCPRRMTNMKQTNNQHRTSYRTGEAFERGSCYSA